MADELHGNLQAYRLQLQQVEAALTTEPNNEDLLKLKKDLSEVIELTKELIKTQVGESSSGRGAAVSTTAAIASNDKVLEVIWKVGDHCMAVSSTSGQYFEAKIEEISGDGQCTVAFDIFGNTELTTLALLKPLEKKKRQVSEAGISLDQHTSKKQIMKQQREYKKKKQQKKVQRMKQLEEEREVEKDKWQDFNSKAFSKNKKGHVKRSIFASPDNVNGRVGVGTCGIGGKPMTEYHHQEKWRKNSMT